METRPSWKLGQARVGHGGTGMAARARRRGVILEGATQASHPDSVFYSGLSAKQTAVRISYPGVPG